MVGDAGDREAAAAIVAHLGKGETATVAQIGIVVAELMAVIAQSERAGQRVRQRREPAEMPGPFVVVERRQTDLCGGAIVAEAELGAGKIGRRDRIEERVAQVEQRGFGAIGGEGLRVDGHAAIWWPLPEGRNHGRLRKPLLVVQ